MTSMIDIMSAISLPGARLIAGRRFRTARNWGIQNARTALAIELLKAGF